MFNWQKLAVHREPEKVTEPIADGAGSTGRPWRLKADVVNVENVGLDYTDLSRATPLTLTVGGVNILLNASAEVGAGPANVTVDDLKIKINRVAFSETGNTIPLVAVDALSLDHGCIDMGTRSVKLARVGAAGGRISVVRGKDGGIQLAEMLAPADRGKVMREIIETGEKARSEVKPWSFRLDAVELNGFNAEIQDLSFDPAIAYDLKDIRVSLNHLTNDGKTPIDFDARLNVEQGGSAKFSGQVSQTGDYAEAQASIADANLKPLHPALARFARLTLESGNLTMSGRMKYRSGESGPQVQAGGSVRLDSFRLNETDTGERFLECKSMSATGLTFGLSPHGLKIQKVRVLEPGAKIVIFEDRSTNLAKAIKSPEVVNVEETSHPTQVPDAAPSTDRAFFPVSIDRVHVEKGVVDFADLSLVLPFASRITEFNGGVTGISSDPASRASQSLRDR